MRALSTFFRLLMLTTALGSSSAWGGETISREDQFKAAYLFNFLKFVDWPPSVANDVLTVCVIGADGVHDTLASGIESKRAGARRLTVRQLDTHASLDGCNVLYAEARDAPSDQRLASASQLSILTVSDASSFLLHGGMIELFTDSNRLRFNINVDNTQRAGLRISSNLLQLAAQVARDQK
ncbi:MAG: YfiR family protein [Steroidobacteraceae bacterium]